MFMMYMSNEHYLLPIYRVNVFIRWFNFCENFAIDVYRFTKTKNGNNFLKKCTHYQNSLIYPFNCSSHVCALFSSRVVHNKLVFLICTRPFSSYVS